MPKTTSKRVRKISDLIHHTLAELLKKEVSDPRLTKLLITGVVVSPDLGHAKIFYTTLEEQDISEIDHALKKGQGYLKTLLAQTTALHHIPKLHFIYDKSVINGSNMSTLINQALVDDQNLHRESED